MGPTATLFIKKILKMGLTILFTHLKIILLQCFQFSATISSIQTHLYLSIYILQFIKRIMSTRPTRLIRRNETAKICTNLPDLDFGGSVVD